MGRFRNALRTVVSQPTQMQRQLVAHLDRQWREGRYQRSLGEGEDFVGMAGPDSVGWSGPRGDGHLAADRGGARDLELVASTLEAAAVPYVVVPVESDSRYRVGVPATFRKRVLRALRALDDDAVQLAVDREHTSEPWAEPVRSLARGRRKQAMQAPRWRVYRADGDEPSGHWRGCEVEYWHLDAGVRGRVWGRGRDADQPVASRGRGSGTLDDVAIGERTYPTATIDVAGPHFDEVTFPIDLVYTWVDGDDPDWLASKNAVLDQLALDDHADDARDPSRYQNNDELRYSLRSVAAYADFVRHIFIVTDGQVPPWLNTDHERITVVPHRDIFPGDDCLPTFNSHAIESRLHHIKGLAEHFLYLNDDFFFGRRVTPGTFFHGNGMTKFFLSQALIGGGDPSNTARSVDAAAVNTRRLIHERFGRRVSHKFKHAPYPQRRSVLYEMEEVLRDEFHGTAASQVRSPRDVAVPSSLFHYYAYLTGRAVPGKVHSRYVSLGDEALARRLRRLRRKENFDVVCLNDSVDPEAGDRESRERILGRFMASYWPTRSPFER